MPVETSIDGAVASVVINRPEAMNAVSPEVLAQLHAAVDEVEASGARVCIVSGTGGRAFSAGADLAEMLEFTTDYAREQMQEGVRLTRRLETSSFISIAAVNGWALGGGMEIVLGCDICVSSPKGKFGLPETTVGIFPGWGGIVRLPRRIPRGLALDVMLSGRILDAEEAKAAGLVLEIGEDAVEVARGVAERLLKSGPQAQLLARSVVQETDDLPLDAALAHATDRWLTLMGTAEREEGHRAFVEKRPPSWQT